MRLLLVRHGQTDYHDPKRAQGWSEIPLNATGRAQAAGLGDALKNVAIDRIVASDLGRAQETVRALGRPFETDARLRERNYGDWEGRDFAQTNAAIVQKARDEGVDGEIVRCPNGESVLDVWERVRPLVDELAKGEGTTLVAAHGGTLAVIVSQLIHGSPKTTHSFHFTNCSITEIERRADGHMLLHRLSETPTDDEIFKG